MAQLPDGLRIIELEETRSTNSEALEAARRGEAGWIWISARRQTAGRGSRGRDWVSMEGNLFASLLLIDPAPLRHLPELTFVTSLAVRSALQAVASGRDVDFKLKWPNDVLCNGRKICGILLENHDIGAGRRAIVIGIGVNVGHHPDAVLHEATDLAAQGIAVSARQLLDIIAVEFSALFRAWDGGRNFGQIRREWLSHASGIGTEIVVRLPGRQMTGVFQEIDADGMLCLRLGEGEIVKLSVADIFFTGDAQGRA